MKKISLIVIILFFSLSSCLENREKEEKKDISLTNVVEDRPIAVKTILATEKDFNYELISNGTVGAMKKAELKFQNQETIRKIHVKNGTWVEKGQTIAELDCFKLLSSLSQAEEAKERALLDLQDILIGQGYTLKDSINIPPQIMKIARIRSNYDQSLNNYSVAKHNLSMATLKAPFSGIIANLWNKEYNYPSGDIFCTVLDNRNPEVMFNVLESEISLLNLNDKVLISPFSSPEFIVEGYVTEINPIIDSNGMVRVKAAFSNIKDKFYEGMNVKIRVQRLLGKRIAIPKSALVMRTNKKVIFTMKNHKAIWNYVETAQENSDSYVVTKGINTGDSVIFDGNINLAHETPVIINPRQ